MAKRPDDVDAKTLRRLNAGLAQSANLAESLAVDFAVLAESLDLGSEVVAGLTKAADLGITRRMALAGELVAASPGGIARCSTAQSDTARGWPCFAFRQASTDLPSALSAMRRFAADSHFGVREWAWLAVRPRIVENCPAAIEILKPWARDEDANIRRFASEATRPRGVWCAHIPLLKAEPEHGLAILEPLRADESRYVQDSVGNWLNDAAKSQPAWVQELVGRWRAKDDGPATRRIAAPGHCETCGNVR